MNIENGIIINQYKIISAIGKGGMGEVFLALDTKLDRKVALKILPPEFAEDADRMSRFVREAKSASALNHPNILTIHEIGESAGTHFIATEFIDGKTLNDYKQANPLNYKSALEIAIQVASALDEAHSAGIVHRDIKPDNVMIRANGLAKILDFGIAKLAGRGDVVTRGHGEEDKTLIAASPRQPVSVSQSTMPGMIIGTANYMSPEQAKGKVVDARTDIFSFGVVLYEMIAGNLPFEGENALEMIGSILNKEPKPLNSEVPTEITKIINKCLRKNRDERYQTIKDVGNDLKDVKQDLEFQDKLERSIVPNQDENKTQILQVTTANESQNQTITNADGKSSNRKIAFAVGSIILLALIGFGVYRFLNPSKTNDVATFEKVKNTKMTKSGKVISTAISPDGKYFAHTTSNDGQQILFVRQTSANNDITVVPTAKVEYWGITFSKDSEYLFYSVRDAGGIAILYRIPALGGTPQKIIDGVDCPVTFSPDGKQMAFVRGGFPNKDESVLMIANADGTGEKALATRKEPERFYPNYFTGPSWSPDGKTIAASVAGIGTNLHSKIIGFNVSDGKETEITKQEWGYIGRVEWLADGKGLMMIARDFAATFQQIWHLSYPNGEARRITSEFKDYRGLSLNADSSKVVTGQTDRMIGVWVASASNLNQGTQILPPNSEGLFVSWTPDGKFLYFNDTAGNSNIGTMEADGSGQRELTSSGNNLIPTISPDGSRIVFQSNPNGSSGASIWIMNRDGSNPKQLTTGLNERNPVFSADGKWVIYTSNTKETMGLWKISVEGGNPVRIADGRYFSPWVSPDGKFIAAFYLEKATTPEQNPNKIAILPIDGGVLLKTFDIQYNPTTGVFVGWSADSKSVIYNQVKDNISNLWSQPISGGQPKQISDFKEGLIYDFDLSRDGKQFVISRGPFSRDAVLISNEK